VDHVQRALMAVYENPESYSALYAYIKVYMTFPPLPISLSPSL